MTAATVHRYDDHTPQEWADFIRAMESGEAFECDRSMFDYWLEVLPPVYMHRIADLPDGRRVNTSFGFVEGAGNIVAFWVEPGPGNRGARYFGCRTDEVYPYS
jgi:hypothetical protein